MGPVGCLGNSFTHMTSRQKNDGVFHGWDYRDAREAIFQRLKQDREVTLGVDRFANIVAKPPPVDPEQHPDHSVTIKLLRRQQEELDARRVELEKQLPEETEATAAAEKTLHKLQEERGELEAENLQAQQKAADLKTKVGELEEKFADVDSRCKQTAQFREDLERQLLEAKKSTEKLQKELKERQHDWVEEEKMLKAQAAESRAEVDLLKKERIAGDEKLELLRKDLEAATRDANQTKATGEKRVAELTAQHGNLRRDIASAVEEQEVAQRKLQLWRDRFDEDTRRHVSQRKSAMFKCQDAKATVAVRQSLIGTNLPAIS